MDIQLPNNWRCRPYQRKLWQFLNGGGKRASICWHRRSGKDDVMLHWTSVSMVRKSATYWYMLPEKEQARTAIWMAVNPHTGMRRIDEAFPTEIFERNESDMMIKCKTNSSTWQIKGSDKYSSLIGSPPAGVVFSEYGRSNPDAWSYLRPILEENNGWALFNGTAFGHNHHERMLKYAMGEPNWFGQILTARDTGLFTDEQLAEILRGYIAERGVQDGQALFDQEYMCSFNAAIPGAIYGSILEDMERMNPSRITEVPYDPGFMVEVWCDLGASEGNDMAMWYTQRIGRETRIIDFDSEINVGIDWMARKLSEKPYYYNPQKSVILPHDAAHPQSSNAGAASYAAKLKKDFGYTNVVNKVTSSVDWSIRLVKQLLPTCVFDAKKCEIGLHAMRSYHRRFNKNTQSLGDKPVHDWTSNAADAFRTGVEHKGSSADPSIRQGEAITIDSWTRPQRRGAIQDSDPLGRD